MILRWYEVAELPPDTPVRFMLHKGIVKKAVPSSGGETIVVEWDDGIITRVNHNNRAMYDLSGIALQEHAR